MYVSIYIYIDLHINIYIYIAICIYTYPPKLSQVFPCDFFVFWVEDVTSRLCGKGDGRFGTAVTWQMV